VKDPPLCPLYENVAASSSNSYVARPIIKAWEESQLSKSTGSQDQIERHAKPVMSERTKITSAQIRAARAMLNWSARELAQRSGVSQSSIHRAERGDGRPSMHEHSLAAIKAAVERCGVAFLGDYGLRLVSAQDIGGDDIVDLSAKKAVMEIGSEWGPGGHPLSVHRSTG
jgi:transcriptional regulator with XRE-family HTH domain